MIVGGLVGTGRGATIVNSYSKVNINLSNADAGGLIGAAEDGCRISKSYAAGVINKSDSYGSVGGLIGHLSLYSPQVPVSVDSSFSVVSVLGHYPGGIVGGCWLGARSSVTNSYWDASKLSNKLLHYDGGCNMDQTNSQSVGSTAYFFNTANPPMTFWDFSNIWVKQSGALLQEGNLLHSN